MSTPSSTKKGYKTEIPRKGKQVSGLTSELVEAFRSRVSKIPDEAGCLVWLRGAFSNGYGAFLLPGRGQFKAHRIAFYLHNGRCNPKLLIRHSCRNKRCCNPEHLSEGTTADNAADAIVHGTTSVGQKNPWVKLTEENVREIRRRRAAGESGASLGREFGVTKTSISYLCRRLTWRHI